MAGMMTYRQALECLRSGRIVGEPLLNEHGHWELSMERYAASFLFSTRVVAVCEGQLDEHGEPFGADVRMSSRGPLATNLAHHLANLVTERLGIKARGEKPGLFGRVSRELRSEIDWEEARRAGEAAVEASAAGHSGVMVTLERRAGADYAVDTGLVSLDAVAHIERTLPEAWIAANGHDVHPDFLTWLRPLVGEVRGYETL